MKLNPVVETANHAKYANRKEVWKKRPFTQRVKKFGTEKDQVGLSFSRSSRFTSTAVSRFVRFLG